MVLDCIFSFAIVSLNVILSDCYSSVVFLIFLQEAEHLGKFQLLIILRGNDFLKWNLIKKLLQRWVFYLVAPGVSPDFTVVPLDSLGYISDHSCMPVALTATLVKWFNLLLIVLHAFIQQVYVMPL